MRLPLHPRLTRHKSTGPGAIKSDLIAAILSAKPSKREAQGFLYQFQPNALTLMDEKLQQRQRSRMTGTGLSQKGHSMRQEKLPPLLTHDFANIKHQIVLLCVEQGLNEQGVSRLGSMIKDLDTLGLSVVVSFVCRESVTKRETFHAALSLSSAIEEAGGRAMPVYEDVLNERTSDLIRSSIDRGHVPVLLPFEEKKGLSRQLPSASAVTSLCSLLTSEFQPPARVIFITEQGGIQTHGTHYKFINLQEEYDDLCRHPNMSGDTVQQLSLVHAALMTLPPTSSAIIMAPSSAACLFANLITDKPLTFASPSSDSLDAPEHHTITPPTYFRKGFTVQTTHSSSDFDRSLMNKLLESSFGRSLDLQAYWKRLDRVFDSAIIAGDYDGAALISQEPDKQGTTIPYLDKFAVAPNRQGMGVADILWNQVRAEYVDLVWRSRMDNPVNKWY